MREIDFYFPFYFDYLGFLIFAGYVETPDYGGEFRRKSTRFIWVISIGIRRVTHYRDSFVQLIVPSGYSSIMLSFDHVR